MNDRMCAHCGQPLSYEHQVMFKELSPGERDQLLSGFEVHPPVDPMKVGIMLEHAPRDENELCYCPTLHVACYGAWVELHGLPSFFSV